MDYTYAPESFRNTDLAAAVEALQVTFGNICADHDISVLDDAGVVVTEYLWDAAKAGKHKKAAMHLGYLVAWSGIHGVESESLAMRIKEVYNELR